MKAISILFFMPFIISFSYVSYSLDLFLQYLQNEGYYDLLLEIKIIFGDDVAINVCKELVKNNKDCETVIRIYLINPYENSKRKIIIEIEDEEENATLEQLINSIKSNLIVNEQEYEKFIQLINIILRYYDVLCKSFDTQKERMAFIRKASKLIMG